MTASVPGSLSIAEPAPDVYVVRLIGTIDRLVAMRVLRLVDARIGLASAGNARTRHLLLDCTAVEHLAHGAADLLRSAYHAAAGRGLGLHRIGRPAGPTDVHDHQALAPIPSFPDLETAVAALTGTSPSTPD